jgi:hypothetical protein
MENNFDATSQCSKAAESTASAKTHRSNSLSCSNYSAHLFKLLVLDLIYWRASIIWNAFMH